MLYLGVCGLGLLLWWASGSPWLSIIANLVVETAALIPSYTKARKDPESETRISWLVGTISVLLTTISVGKLDLQLLVLPGVSFLLQVYMVYILYSETKTKESPSKS